jgi:hypothetical protein
MIVFFLQPAIQKQKKKSYFKLENEMKKEEGKTKKEKVVQRDKSVFEILSTTDFSKNISELQDHWQPHFTRYAFNCYPCAAQYP